MRKSVDDEGIMSKQVIELPEGFIPDGYEFVRLGPANPGDWYINLTPGTLDYWDAPHPSSCWYVIVRKIPKPKWPERLKDWPAVAYAIDEDGLLWVYEKVPEGCPYWSTDGEEYFLPREFIPEFYPNGVPEWKDSLVKREDCE